MKIDDLLNQRVHAITAIDNMTILGLTLNPRNLDILQIGHTRYLVSTPKIHEQSAVDGGEDDSLLKGCADNCSLWQMDRHLLVTRHQHIGVESLALFPRISNGHHCEAIV